MPVTVIVDGQAQTVHTRAKTVQQLLTKMQIETHDGDNLSSDVHEPLTSDMVLELARAHPIQVDVDGQTYVYRTVSKNPQSILDDLGIRLEENDQILLDDTKVNVDQLVIWPIPVRHIVVQRAFNLTVTDGGMDREIIATGNTVGDVLYEADIPLYAADIINPDPNTL